MLAASDDDALNPTFGGNLLSRHTDTHGFQARGECIDFADKLLPLISEIAEAAGQTERTREREGSCISHRWRDNSITAKSISFALSLLFRYHQGGEGRKTPHTDTHTNIHRHTDDVL